MAPPTRTVESVPKPAVPATSLAVRPFVNRSADAENQFVSDGLSEDLDMSARLVQALSRRSPCGREYD